MKIERLGPASAHQLAALHARCFDQAWSEAEFTALLHLSSSHLIAARKSAKIAGFILCRAAIDEAEILTFGVDPSLRRKGLGQKLLAAAARELAQNGIQRMFLEVSTRNDAAKALYSQAGYSEIARRTGYYRDGSDALILEKSLIERGQA